MKNKFLSFALLLCLVIPSIFMFSACKDNEPKMETWDGTTTIISNAVDGVITIDTAEELAGFAKAVNDGNNFHGLTVKLACDMDMDGRNWIPIGTGSRSNAENAKFFSGTFDGNNKKIIGLKNGSYLPQANNKTLEGDFASSTVYTYHYGFFGLTENATIKNLEVNVDFNCDALELKGDSVGGIVGFANKGITIENCVVSGTLKGYDAIGGIIGRAYNSSEENKVIIKSCVNNANVTGLFKAAGVLGYISSGEFNATIDNCTNNGTISVVGCIRGGKQSISMVSGIFTYGWTTSNNSLFITNNSNKGTINACETLDENFPNIHAYAYIGINVYNPYDQAKHSYNFNGNSNTGNVNYLGEKVEDSLLLVLNQKYPTYDASWEANNTNNLVEE